MLVSRIKVITALLAVTLAGAGLRAALTWADGRPQPDGSFRVTVHEVVHDDSIVVTQIDIETRPGSTVALSSDKDKRGGTTFRSDATSPNRPAGPARVRVIVFADQVEWKAGETTLVKFMVGHKVGSISGSTSETVSMPAGAKQLSDLLTVPIKSGQYKYGSATTLAAFKGVTYSLLVTGPE
jgi:hypothetical protein